MYTREFIRSAKAKALHPERHSLGERVALQIRETICRKWGLTVERLLSECIDHRASAARRAVARKIKTELPGASSAWIAQFINRSETTVNDHLRGFMKERPVSRRNCLAQRADRMFRVGLLDTTQIGQRLKVSEADAERLVHDGRALRHGRITVEQALMLEKSLTRGRDGLSAGSGPP